jgi:alkanesulfonate monooxygenase SsuD/methylene tetrahydromethanopterin reductase-like flavin-dependent oxidoreductase (luciferase family)
VLPLIPTGEHSVEPIGGFVEMHDILYLVRQRLSLLFGLARRENLTIRQLYQRIAGGRGHFQTFGTAKQVADMMEECLGPGRVLFQNG